MPGTHLKICHFCGTLAGGVAVNLKNFVPLSPGPRLSYDSNSLPAGNEGSLLVTQTRCNACRECVRHCPANCLDVQGKQGKVQQFEVDYGRCILCSRCVEVCPRDALVMRPNIQAGPTRDRSNLRTDPRLGGNEKP